MHRDHKVKETRRRARLLQQRTAQVTVTTKLIPDRRRKLIERAEKRHDDN